MSLELTINEAIKNAMREKDKIALDSLRAVKSQILLLKTEAKGADVSAEQEIAILQRMIKQRKDSYEQFVAQNRNDLAEVELAQMKVIEQFLPAQLSAEELEAEIKKIISDVISNVNKKMPTYKHIKNFVIRDKEFEKTTTKKIKRYGNNLKND